MSNSPKWLIINIFLILVFIALKFASKELGFTGIIICVLIEILIVLERINNKLK